MYIRSDSYGQLPTGRSGRATWRPSRSADKPRHSVTFQQLGCLAGELVLRLLLHRAKATLDLYGLLDSGVSAALESFADGVYEDLDHEWLYDDSMDGIDEDPAAASLGTAAMGIKSWFTPFNGQAVAAQSYVLLLVPVPWHHARATGAPDSTFDPTTVAANPKGSKCRAARWLWLDACLTRRPPPALCPPGPPRTRCTLLTRPICHRRFMEANSHDHHRLVTQATDSASRDSRHT